ncbi:MAG: hypothetical protein J6Q40_04555 [Tidjanibacter sp.]|nr:hypothetical protein [Tidjanibacter sp.]
MLALLSVGEAMGQSYAEFRRELSAPDSLYFSTVEVTEHSSAATVERHIISREQENINGYRITIYLDKGQKARTEAFEARDKFQLLFPGEATYVSYEDPYWVVSVGNCTTSDSAMILLGKVGRVFEKAYLIRAAIPVEEILKEHNPALPTTVITE